MKKSSKIYIAGHRGLVGSAICRKLEHEGYTNIITRTRAELDLTCQRSVADFFEAEKPEYVFLAAAKVGGIHANNTFRADFIYENLMIQANIIHQSYLYGVRKLLFLGSSCIFPRLCRQPMKEEYLMTGSLERTNSPYAVAKIAGIEMCWSYNEQHGTRFLPVMPTNLYGPGDNFDLKTSHVLPALIRKFHEAKESALPSVSVWGSGAPRREFLHVDDLADACLFLINYDFPKETYLESPLYNIGTGTDLSIKALAELIKDTTGFSGDIVFDPSMPDGTPRKLLDVSRIADLGWRATISLEDGLRTVYRWYRDQVNWPRSHTCSER